MWYDPGGSRPIEGPYLIASIDGCFYALCYENNEYDPVPHASKILADKIKLVV